MQGSMKYHPEGVAALIAVIVAPEDVAKLRVPTSLTNVVLRRAIDRRRDEILAMARQYYKVHDQDYEEADPRPEMVNGTNNRAKLDRANILR
jgi:hypothetical protein